MTLLEPALTPVTLPEHAPALATPLKPAPAQATTLEPALTPATTPEYAPTPATPPEPPPAKPRTPTDQPHTHGG